MPFLVTGFPRSRTAWLAAALSSGKTSCYHEGLLLGVPRLTTWLVQPDRGDSDSGLLTDYGYRVIETFKEAPVVLVHRARAEVLPSWQKFLGNLATKEELVRILDMIEKNVERVKATHNCLLVPYEDVSDPAVGALIWNHCGLTDFNAERWEILSELNVQQKL